MKGILLKDALTGKRVLMICVLMILLFYPSGSSGMFFVLSYSIMVPVNLLALDERSRFERYAAILPLTGLQCVADKYIMTYLCMTVMLLLSVLAAWMRTGAAVLMDSVLLCASMVLVTHALTMPPLIRVGVARGQWIYLLAIIIEFGASAAIGKLGGEGILQTVEAFAGIIFFAALTINVGSMFVSARLFDQRMEL